MMRHEIVDVLARHSIGRICFLDGTYPIALPVNYRFDRDGATERIVIQTTASSQLAQAHGPASFELDEFDFATGRVWTVLVRGTLRRVLDTRDLPSTQPLLPVARDQFLALTVTSLSGRHFSLAPNPGG